MKTKILTIEVTDEAYAMVADLLAVHGVMWTESKWMSDD